MLVGLARIVLLSMCTGYAEECTIIEFEYQEAKICGDKVYNRNYACDNELFDKNVKKYREEYDQSKGERYCNDEWCGLKPYLQDHNTCEPAWDLKENYDGKDYTRWRKICDDWGNCFAESYYDVIGRKRFYVRETIAKAERPIGSGGYGGKSYALGSLNLQLELGSVSKKKTTKEYSRCVKDCFDEYEDHSKIKRCVDKCRK